MLSARARRASRLSGILPLRRFRRLLPLFTAFALLAAPSVGRAQTPSPAEQLAGLAARIDSAIEHMSSADVTAAQTDYQAFSDGWNGMSDALQAQSPNDFQSITDEMSAVSSALMSDPLDSAAAEAALQALHDQTTAFVAQSQPTLTLYSAQHQYTTRALVDAFQQQTGIAVRVHYGDDFELAHQLVEEGSSSPGDVFFTENSPPLALVDEQGLLARVDPSTLARVSANYNASTGNWVGVAARETVLVYNPQVLGDAQLPQSVLDLGQAAWKGKLAIAPAEPDFQPVVSAVIHLRGEAAAESWLAGFKQNATIYNDNEGIVAAVENGQAGAAIVNHYYWFRAAADTGGPASMRSKLAYFAGGDPGAMLDVSGAGILRSAAHPDLARRFLDFLVSRTGETALVSSGDFEYPLGSGVAASPQVERFDHLQPPNLTPGDLGNGQDAVELLQKVGLL